ncbi:MAG: tyrosine-type recombinase/integrase [Bacilli bacterium]|nr:tyrosine-type recombinase/integrase [Bacilli bacterium]
MRFHDLPHNCATLLCHNGVRMEDIQKWLGHSTIPITEQIYAHYESRARPPR